MQVIYDRLRRECGLAVGILDADLVDHGTRHPNLALLKISSFCKMHGHSVSLLLDYSDIASYDAVFLSCVFSFTKLDEDVLDMPNVYCGGTGIFPDGGEDLPNDVEHACPDYSLYDPYVARELARGRRRSALSDYMDYSIGFTTRGCFRKCSFCVNKKYSHVFVHAPVQEFLDTRRPYIYLWDDNFLGFKGWRKVLEELNATGKPFQFRQGLDVRLMTDEKACVLSRSRYHGDFIFAFDHLEDRPLIERKLRIWRAWTDRGTRLYVLSGYDSQDERDIESVFQRIAVLMKYDCLPYIMRYESYKSSRWRALYVNIARWCNQPQFFKKKSFREFCEANQAYHKTEGTFCSAYKAMTDFEKEFPDIAERYFDLRFEEESMLKRFGRPFYTRPSSELLDEQRDCWMRFVSDEMDDVDALSAYFSKKLDIMCARYLDEVNPSGGGCFEKLFSLIRRSSLGQIYAQVLKFSETELISTANVPQFSSIDSALRVPEVLCALDEAQTFDQLGVYLDYDSSKKVTANKKYGENHAKLATLLDLADIVSGAPLHVCATPFSERFRALSLDEQRSMTARLAFRIPIIQRILIDAAHGSVDASEYLKPFSESTKKRRLPNLRTLFVLIEQHACEDDERLLNALSNVRL